MVDAVKRDESPAQEQEFNQAVHDVMREVWPDDDIFVKQRQPQTEDKQRAQYQRLSEQAVFMSRKGHQFEVNLSDYLDTGLFLIIDIPVNGLKLRQTINRS